MPRLNKLTLKEFALAAENAKLRRLLAEAAGLIEKLAEQQAMPDQSYEPKLAEIRKNLATE